MIKKVISYWSRLIGQIGKYFKVFSKDLNVYGVFPPQVRRAVKFCFSRAQMPACPAGRLKFIPRFLFCTKHFPRWRGLGGGFFAKFLFFHPPASFALLFCYQQKPSQSEGDSHRDPPTLNKNFNAFVFIKYPILWKGLGCIILLLSTSCNLLDPEEQLPAFLEINNFELTTSPVQGENSAQITDAWVFVNDLSLGIFELPATVPVLDLGSQNITIFPVIRENGLRSSPVIYSLYRRYESTLELMANQTVPIQPTTTYEANAVFELVEDFNTSNHLLKGTDQSAVQSVDGIGKIALGEKDAVEFTSTTTFIDLPTSGGLPVFLEIDYKNNVAFEIGLVGISNTINATSYKVTLCPINRWNKVYINFQEDLQLSQLPSYKLAFRVSTEDLGCGGAVETNPEVLIDNVKFIRLKN